MSDREDTSGQQGLDHSNDNLVLLGAITAVVLPLVGVACAIALMARGDRRGGTILVVATVVFVAALLALAVLAA